MLIYFLKTKSLLVGFLVMGVSWVGAETGSVLVLQIFSRGKAYCWTRHLDNQDDQTKKSDLILACCAASKHSWSVGLFNCIGFPLGGVTPMKKISR